MSKLTLYPITYRNYNSKMPVKEDRNGKKVPIPLSTFRSVTAALDYLCKVRPEEFSEDKYTQYDEAFYYRSTKKGKEKIFSWYSRF